MQDIHKIVDFVTKANWLILVAGGAVAAMLMPGKVALGVIFGGLIVAVNFHLLKNTLKKMIDPEVISAKGRSVISNVLMKYYFRFVISAAIIFVLISNHIVHPLGLLAGLSVVVASIFMATALEIKRILFKEAV
jgi:hypothetical protein